MASFAETEATINKLSKTAYKDLTDVLAKLKTHAEKARSELLAGNYTSSWTHVEYLGYEQDLYTWNSDDDLYNEWYAIYLEFSNWLGSWEM